MTGRGTLLGVAIGLLAGCTAQPTESPEAGAGDSSRFARGKAVYERVCSACHASGLHGAPVPGDKAAWSSRSSLWQAVLYQHAEKGYLGMPPKGGDPELSDAEVEAAAEYMLNLTFQNRPPDPG